MPTRKCPRCGFEVSKGEKVLVRIWTAREYEKIWERYASEFDTKEMAFIELLKKGNLLILERQRVAVEKTGP